MPDITFSESGMTFCYPDTDLFRIEESPTYESLGRKVKICEAIVAKSGKVILIEAKSSFSKPGNKEDFRKNIEDIYEKFLYSLLLYTGILIDRPYTKKTTISHKLSISAIKGSEIHCRLIIKGFKPEWLSPVNEAIQLRCHLLRRVFSIDSVLVIDDSRARKKGLIV